MLWPIAVLQLLYTGRRMISGFFLKKKLRGTQLTRVHELENCSNLAVNRTLRDSMRSAG
jgi:hypothetical protein